jgi:hypothetical protein
MKRLAVIVFVFCAASCHQNVPVGPVTNNTAMQQDIEKTWAQFIEAVSENNVNKLKSVATPEIRCLLCLDNTGQESSELQKFMDTDPNWYNKLYDHKIYIPLDKFFTEDVPLIFTKDLIGKMKAGKVKCVGRSNGKEAFCEVPVAAIEPGRAAPADEGVLYLFLFKKTADGYKFSGIDTIP